MRININIMDPHNGENIINIILSPSYQYCAKINRRYTGNLVLMDVTKKLMPPNIMMKLH